MCVIHKGVAWSEECRVEIHIYYLLIVLIFIYISLSFMFLNYHHFLMAKL